MAKFADVINALIEGKTAWRNAWDIANHGIRMQEIVRQIPQVVSKEIVPKMTSLPDDVKLKVSGIGSGQISYHDQVIMITFVDDGKTPASATYYIPTWEDIFAEDWGVAIPAE